MGLFLGWCHRLICIVLSLCKHACKEVCDVNPGIDPYPLLARSCARWWPDFVTFTTRKKSRFGLKRVQKAQCVSNRCKDLFERKRYLGVRCTLRIMWNVQTAEEWFSLFQKLVFAGIQAHFFLKKILFMKRPSIWSNQLDKIILTASQFALFLALIETPEAQSLLSICLLKSIGPGILDTCFWIIVEKVNCAR